MNGKALSIQQISELSSMSERNVQRRAAKEVWKYTEIPGKGRGGKVRRYDIDDLPEDIRLLYNKVCLTSPPAVRPSEDLTSQPEEKESIACLSEDQIKRASAKTDLLFQYTRALSKAKWGHKVRIRDNFIQAYNTGEAFPQIFAALGEVSWQTLEGWKRAMKTNKDLSVLSDKRGQWRKGRSLITEKQAKIILQCAFHPNRWLMAEVIREAKSRMHALGIDNGFSEATYRRWLTDFKEHNYDIWCWQRGGEQRWNDECALALIRNPELINVGDVLVADGHKFNFEIINPWTGKPQRMTLVLFYDMRSNFPCGWEIMPTENTKAIHAALRRAILTLGKMPRVVYLDNGRAFKGKIFTDKDIDLRQSGLAGLYDALGIQTVFAWPYHGQSKTVERFFETMAEFERKCPTYVGTGIDKKPPRMLRGERLHRRIYDKVMAGECLTMEMTHMALAAWFDEYIRRPQLRSIYLKGDAPIDLFMPGRGEGIDPLELTYLMWAKKEAYIRASRISFGGRFYYHEALEGRHHQVEIRYDLQDPGYIAVYEGGVFICIASEQEKIHPMARILGDEEDQELHAKYVAIRQRQKKQASFLGQLLLENEVLPSHLRRLEMDGVTPTGPPNQTEEPEQKQLTQADKKRIQSEVAQYNKTKPALAPDVWAGLDDLPEADRYEKLIGIEAQGLLVPREHAAFMRYFEQTSKYSQLEKMDYWENVRIRQRMIQQIKPDQNTRKGAVNE